MLIHTGYFVSAKIPMPLATDMLPEDNRNFAASYAERKEVLAKSRTKFLSPNMLF